MKAPIKILIVAVSMGWLPLSLEAGNVQHLKDGSTVAGKLSLTATATGIHVDGSSGKDVDLSDVLEATFSDVPFQVQYVDLRNDTGNKLPSNWVTKGIGAVDPSSSASYEAGTLTLSSDGCELEDPHPDHYYFAGMPWSGDGQWTAYIKDDSEGEMGICLRDSLEEGAVMYGAGVPGWVHTGGTHKDFDAPIPTWLRVTRIGPAADVSYSTDGTTWIIGSEDNSSPRQAWAGFMFNGRMGTTIKKGKVNGITFTPPPPQPETMPPGVLFKSGTFMTNLSHFYLSDTGGGISHGTQNITMKPDQVAAISYRRFTLKQLDAAHGQTGLIMANGDFIPSTPSLVQGGGTGGMAEMNTPKGKISHYPDSVRICNVNAVAPLPSDYEVRLNDGSIIRAKSFAMTNGQLTINEISGVTIPVDPREIAQIRAGLAQVQPLINLPWTSKSDSSTKTTPADPDSAAATDSLPDVMTWTGPNQEQIFTLPVETPIEFPLSGKFRALAMQVALAPGVPEQTKATLHVSVGGKEIISIPEFTAGEQPRSLWLNLPDSGPVTMSVSSFEPQAHLMVIDPVAVRPSTAPE